MVHWKCKLTHLLLFFSPDSANESYLTCFCPKKWRSDVYTGVFSVNLLMKATLLCSQKRGFWLIWILRRSPHPWCKPRQLANPKYSPQRYRVRSPFPRRCKPTFRDIAKTLGKVIPWYSPKLFQFWGYLNSFRWTGEGTVIAVKGKRRCCAHKSEAFDLFGY